MTTAQTYDRELTADDIFSSNDIATERLEVPEWGGFVRVRGLTGMERDSFEQSMLDKKVKGRSSTVKLDNLRAGLVARCIVDSDNKRLFTDQQVARLGNKSASALDRVYTVAARLSGLGDSDVEELIEDFTEETPEPSTSV